MSSISSDAPIRAKGEDRLGYLSFSKALARSVAHRPPGDGFVIGVQAAWGMGKSSAINLALEAIAELEEGGAAKTRVRHFNPWLFSGLEVLIRGYLSELGRVIDETVNRDTPQGTRKVVEKLVKGGAEMAGGAAALAALVMSSGAAAPWAASIKSGVTGALNLGAHVLDNRSLDDTIVTLRAHLSQIEGRLLVVMDDLDRLQPDELRQILTLVKTFGNLPNVIHLLVYDRTIVDATLGAPAPGQPSFREKIVQVELDLPPPDRDGLRKMTFERLISIIGENPPMAQTDWWEVTQIAFAHYLRTPRDVIRLTNAISVSWPGVAGEVYVPDFVAMELMRHFERATYDAVRELGDFLTGRGSFMPQDDKKLFGRRIANTIPEMRRSAVISLLAGIFPAARQELDGDFAMFRSRATKLSGRRVGEPSGFDAYFGFSVSGSVITVADLRVLADNLADGAMLRARMRAALDARRPDGTSFAGQLLNELAALVEPLSGVPDTLLHVLLEFGDEIIAIKDEEREFFTTDNRRRLHFLFGKLLDRTRPDDRRETVMAAVLAPTSSIHAASYVVAEIAQEHGLGWRPSVEPRERPLLSEDETRELGEAYAARAAEAARQGALATRPQISTVLLMWETFLGPEGPRSFVRSKLADAGSLSDIVFQLMARTTSEAEPFRYRSLQGIPRDTIYDAEAMADALEGHLASGAIPEADVEDAGRFVRQARRLLARAGRGNCGDLTAPSADADDSSSGP